jgi:hypothetical protein
MGLLVEPRLRALDNSGNAISGATLTVYETTTSTPAALYSTSALAEAGGAGDLANPLTADANGYFATVFIENEQVVDVTLKNAGGTTLYQAAGVTAVSGALSSLDLDFTTNGRARFRGAANIVRLEIGDPEGDDTGGDFALSGWAGTQMTTYEVDAASVTVTGNETIEGNLDVDGTITGNSGKGIDVVYSSGTAAAAATVDIALPSAFDAWELEIINLNISDATLSARYSYDNASTFHASGGAYRYSNPTSNTTGTLFNLAENCGTGGASATVFRIFIYGKSDEATSALWTGFIRTAAASAANTGGMHMTNVLGKPSHIRFLAGAGNVAFRYVLRSRKQS